ncbi:hypothetical protein ABTK04_17850, partial [Acinetobacter baumannii]|nr:hypothetical protein [Acinetobacter baumannii]
MDQQAVKGNIEFWVRNLVRKEGCSFYLQKGNGRFYPDFICKLPNGKILVVVIYAELSGDFPLGDSRQPIYKSLRP